MKDVCILVLFVLSNALSLQSQVTIGANTVPLAGALLQLTEGGSTTKGLGMPRVKLTNLNDIKVDIQGVQAGQEIVHTGLMVYNTNKCLNHSGNDDGLYVWTGSEWNPLKNMPINSDVQVYEDKRDPDNVIIYPYRTFGDAGVWMLRDIRATKYDTGIDGSMTLNGGISTTNHYYAYPGKDINPPTDASDFLKNENLGLLYNTAATLNLGSGTGQITLPTTNEWNTAHAQRQGVCPNGWHVPSILEWAALQKYIYNNASTYSTSSTTSFSPTTWNDAWSTNVPIANPLDYRGSGSSSGHGQAMRSPCDPEGNLTDGTSFPPMQGGFAAILGGDLAYPSNAPNSPSISRRSFGQHRHYWASTSRDNDFLFGFFLSKNNVKVGVGSHVKFFMDAVRCKKN